MTETERISDQYRNAACTLNGKPAIISGNARLYQFARVSTLPNGESYEWSWHSVQLVMENQNRRFRS